MRQYRETRPRSRHPHPLLTEGRPLPPSRRPQALLLVAAHPILRLVHPRRYQYPLQRLYSRTRRLLPQPRRQDGLRLVYPRPRARRL